jgi:hypothetical protein
VTSFTWWGHASATVELAVVPIGGWGPTLEDGHLDPVDGAVAVGWVGATRGRCRGSRSRERELPCDQRPPDL